MNVGNDRTKCCVKHTRVDATATLSYDITVQTCILVTVMGKVLVVMVPMSGATLG